MGIVNEESTINIEIPAEQIKPQEAIEKAPAEQTEEKKVGRPCGFCSREKEIMQIATDYLQTGKGEKPKMIYINELALLIGCDRDIVTDWKNKKMKGGKLEHPEFNRVIKELETIQELRLQQRLLSRYNPTGSIFLLKTKHGYIETEKQVHAGDPDEPLEIMITEERPRTDG